MTELGLLALMQHLFSKERTKSTKFRRDVCSNPLVFFVNFVVDISPPLSDRPSN
jgi:hypothetical protein